MAVTASKLDAYHDVRGEAFHRYRFFAQDNVDTVVAATPGEGYQYVVVGWQLHVMSTDALFQVKDGSGVILQQLFPEAVDASGRVVFPPPAEPGTAWVPIGEDEPLEISMSAGTATGVIYYTRVAV